MQIHFQMEKFKANIYSNYEHKIFNNIQFHLKYQYHHHLHLNYFSLI